jgi:hypothetical protein
MLYLEEDWDKERHVTTADKSGTLQGSVLLDNQVECNRCKTMTV